MISQKEVIFISEEKKQREYRGTITRILRPARRGDNRQPFAFVDLSEPSFRRLKYQTVTFTLADTVWKDVHEPQVGLEVVPSSLQKFDTGWRAMSARPVKPEDSEEK
ncbi:MAG: hypothetical protein HZA95_00625 [Candidatus Vogelbacteria bacterium]|nr:hypothetical protein [Candidatus Vogelbacteria bacterium]